MNITKMAGLPVLGGKVMQEGQFIDQEWVDLIWEAKKLGISIEEIKDFLSNGDLLAGLLML